MWKRRFAAGLFLFLVTFNSFAQRKLPGFINSKSYDWADSILNKMSIEEKIGQLFMVEVQSIWPQRDLDSLAVNISKYNIGGIIVFKGGPLRQAEAINRYQSVSKIPLLVSIDGEWGLSMRMDSTMRFPRQMTLSALKDDSLIYEMGAEIARQCKRIGIHIDFAPDIDINNNPLNPVISTRSFGEDKVQVSDRAMLYMRGLEDNKIISCGKHFPGHGDTDVDSHLSLPVINKDEKALDTLELYPFRQLIKNGVSSMMVAHLNVPKLDDTENIPASLSKPVITGMLKDDMDFQGIVFTDALNMKAAIPVNSQPGDMELRALMAGNDILLMSENVPAAFEKIMEAVKKKKIRESSIDERLRKILMVKHWVGLNNYTPIDIENIYKDLNTSSAAYLNYKLFAGATTALINKEYTVPLNNLLPKSIAALQINDSTNNTFQQTLGLYANVRNYGMKKDASPAEVDSLVSVLAKNDYVILSIHNTSTKPQINYGITDAMNNVLEKLSTRSKLIVCLFGNTYCLNKLKINPYVKALIISYEDTYLPQFVTAQALFGGVDVNGQLPVTPLADFKRGDGLYIKSSADVMKYTLPQELSIDELCLQKVDSLVKDAIAKKAMPGCQVFASIDGKVIYNKSFGTTLYDSSKAITNDMLYDVASVTKISATALAAMWLYENGRLDLSKTISFYLPEFEKSNKANITLDEMLTHRAGLIAWIPFYKLGIAKNGKLMKRYFSIEQHGDYSIQVADSLFLNEKFTSKIWKQIIESPLTETGKYVYSDLGLLIVQRIIEKQSGQSLDSLVSQEFYTPLNLTHLTFNPLTKFKLNDIVPTENDTVFRHQIVQGYVHDPAAALMGGVAGNAGVFSNAQNLGLIMQMLLNGGVYGSKRFLQQATIDYFTSSHFAGNRRGFIFDKAEADPGKPSPCCKSSSVQTYGHQGFTGTCTWADPATKMVYVFLSNRVYPTAVNNKLSELNVRTNIQQVFYDCMKKGN